MQKIFIADPNKSGVRFVFLGDYMLAKVMPIENDAFHLWSDEAPAGSLVCEYVTGGVTFHANVDEVILAIKNFVDKLALDLLSRREVESDHAHYVIH